MVRTQINIQRYQMDANYYKKDNKVYVFNDLQVRQVYTEGYTKITEEEADALRTPTYTEEELKYMIKEKMKDYVADYIGQGAIVIATIGGIEYRAVIHSCDDTLRGASGVLTYKNGVDSNVPAPDLGPFWFCKDDCGAQLDFPIDDDMIINLAVYSENWGVLCNKVYKERKRAMYNMEDVTGFDFEQDLNDYLPSREVVIS